MWRFLRFGTDFEPLQRLPFLLQNADHVVARASTQPYENKIGGAVTGLAIAIDCDGNAAIPLPFELEVLFPGRAGSIHCLSPVVGLWLRVNENAEQLRRFLLEAAFERGRYIVDTRQWQFIRKCAVAGNIHTIAYVFHTDVVRIENLGEL